MAVEGRHLDTRSFLFARYASLSASALYAGVGFGRAGMFFGIVQNPRSGYRELIAGGLTRVAGTRHSLTLGLAAADASDGDYAQLYLLPGLSWGALALDGNVKWYEPLERAGARQLALNPLSLSCRLGPHLRAGASYVGSFSARSDPQHRGGPALRLAIPHGSLEVEILAGLQHSGDEVRTTVRAGF